jgi:uncharacterized protein YqjF (DUF2071 family)
MNHDFNTGILDEVGHRPWPMPDWPWLMTQTWNDLLFARWAIDPALLRRKVPDVYRNFRSSTSGHMSESPISPASISSVSTPAAP